MEEGYRRRQSTKRVWTCYGGARSCLQGRSCKVWRGVCGSLDDVQHQQGLNLRICGGRLGRFGCVPTRSFVRPACQWTEAMAQSINQSMARAETECARCECKKSQTVTVDR